MSVEEILRLIEACDREQAERMPDEQAALRQMFDAYDRLTKLGWSDAIYCPKDGTTFDAIEAGSTGVHDCYYSGTWPKGSWWIVEAGDHWPSRPVLHRLKPGQDRRNRCHPRLSGRGDDVGGLGVTDEPLALTVAAAQSIHDAVAAPKLRPRAVTGKDRG